MALVRILINVPEENIAALMAEYNLPPDGRQSPSKALARFVEESGKRKFKGAWVTIPSGVSAYYPQITKLYQQYTKGGMTARKLISSIASLTGNTYSLQHIRDIASETKRAAQEVVDG